MDFISLDFLSDRDNCTKRFGPQQKNAHNTSFITDFTQNYVRSIQSLPLSMVRLCLNFYALNIEQHNISIDGQ